MEAEKKEIIEILAKVLEIDPELADRLSPEEDLRNLGLDSLNMIKVIVLLEERFEVTFDFEDLFIEKVNTIKNIQNTLEILQGRDA